MAEKPSKLPAWHEGEKFIQEKLGVLDRMDVVGRRVIRDFMPDQHRAFYTQLPFIVLGSVDARGDAWATFVEGEPGFIASPTRCELAFAARPHPADPAAQGMVDGAPVGLLGMEMHTRRRNRMNGVYSPTAAGFRVDVDQSFGNCPRYIQLREFSFERDPIAPFAGEVEELVGLDASARALIARADAFFVASYADRAERRQVDVSHRGGKAGFVRIADDGTFTIPDFDGNLFFNTLGNIVLNGKAGLLFVDFASGDMLQLSGDAAVVFDSPEIAAFQGAERLWTFTPRRIVRRPAGLALRWRFQDNGWSDNSLMTGDWQQAAERLRALEFATRWRGLKVTRIVDESASIRSFYLHANDGAGLLPHLPGQHLPIRVQLPGSEQPVIRTYTLSHAPSDDGYRISVKREGLVSNHLHEQLREGDLLEARAPSGGFTLDMGVTRPVVLLAGGVGITPMLAMLRHIVYEGLRKQKVRPTTLFYAARSKHDRAFDQEIAGLVAAAKGAVKLVRVLGDPVDALIDADYEAEGRIEMTLLGQYLAFGDYEFYLCGPPPFMQAIYDGLRGYNIADERIHAEAFGPASLMRTPDPCAAATVPARLPPATESVPVVFTESLKEARWTPGGGTLLELAEARGLEPEYSCREGSCGTCRTKLVKGAVTYIKEPSATVAADEVLVCCAVPAQQADGATGGLQLAL